MPALCHCTVPVTRESPCVRLYHQGISNSLCAVPGIETVPILYQVRSCLCVKYQPLLTVSVLKQVAGTVTVFYQVLETVSLLYEQHGRNGPCAVPVLEF